MKLTLSSSVIRLTLVVASFTLLAPAVMPPARAADKAPADVLTFSNGDTLTGTLDHVEDGKVFFKSKNAGTVQVAWKDLKDLHATGTFAVIEKGTAVRRKHANKAVPVGTISIAGTTLTVTTASGTQDIPVDKIAYIIDEPTFTKVVQKRQGILQGITGSISAGASTVNSTQNSVSINTAVLLTRVVPPVTWMPPHDRTILNFTSNYGKVTQPATPTVKTSILHASLEEDEYLNPRFYILQQAIWDHNFSQGLDLQQLYGAGAGYTAIKNSKQELDLIATVNYTQQQFSAAASTPSTTVNLIGSSFGDNYTRDLPKKIVLTEVAVFNPAWNILSDYSANVSVGATFPVFKNFGLSVGVVDSYLNDPPAGFQGNSVQFNTGLTYSIQ